MTAFVYSLATFYGQKIKKLSMQKYVVKIREDGRSQRRHSSFYISLYGYTWVNFKESCGEVVIDLMRLNHNKLSSVIRTSRYRFSNLATRPSNALTCCFSSITSVASLSNILSRSCCETFLLEPDDGNGVAGTFVEGL